MLAERQEKNDGHSSPKDGVKNWMFKRKKYAPPTEKHSERYSRPENSAKQLIHLGKTDATGIGRDARQTSREPLWLQGVRVRGPNSSLTKVRSGRLPKHRSE
jgi:hypothetical protein